MDRRFKPIAPIEEMTPQKKYYWKNKTEAKEGKIQRKEEIKREFEEFLNEESAKYPLGFNPYQE